MGPQFTYQSTWGSSFPATLQATGSVHVVTNIFTFAVNGFIVGVRFYRTSTTFGDIVGIVQEEADNNLLGVVQFRWKASGAAAGWEHAYFPKRIRVTSGTRYNVGASCSDRLYRFTTNGIPVSGLTVGDITTPADSTTHWNGQFGPAIGRLGWTHAARTRYGIDPLFLRGDLH
jgi:hypothetical protein